MFSTWPDLPLLGGCEVTAWLGSCTSTASLENKSHPCVNMAPNYWRFSFHSSEHFVSFLKNNSCFHFPMFQMQLLPWALGACTSVEQPTSDRSYRGNCGLGRKRIREEKPEQRVGEGFGRLGRVFGLLTPLPPNMEHVTTKNRKRWLHG